MLGDGLNDAGALGESDVGIAVTDNINNFTPASDAILDAKQLSHLNEFLRVCKLNKKIVLASFIISIIYNLVGLTFAVTGQLSPMIAAILMPASSICIFFITYFGTTLLSKRILANIHHPHN